MEQKDKNIITDKKYRCLVDDKTKNWKRISLNDFGVEYSKDFQERMKNSKPIRIK